MEKKPYVKECPVCKKLFNPYRETQICCSASCSHKRYNKEVMRGVRQDKKSSKDKKRKSNGPDLARMNDEARARGMTYGQYVAWLYANPEQEV